MRNFKSIVFRPKYSLLVVLMLVFVISACGGGGDDGPSGPTDQEQAQELLEGTWTLNNGGTIVLDGQNVNANYVGFTLVVGDGTFTTTNAGDLFPSTGTWQWVGQTDNQAQTGRGKALTFTTLNATTFAFSFTKTSSNAAAGVSGNYVMTLKK